MDSELVARLTRELAVRKRVQEALLLFSRGVSANLGFAPALESLTVELTAIFGVRRTSVWMHERRGRVLSLAASSDPRESATASAISTDEDSMIARGLRLDGPEMTATGEAQCLLVPLRGWRRALGAIVIEGESREVDSPMLMEIGADLGRQLSIAVERVLVLNEVLGDVNEQPRLRSRLAQAEKLAALGQFIAGIAHEINNPLQGVLGYAELMLGSIGPDHPHRADLRRIYLEADRAAEIVRNLLVFTGSQRSPRKPIEIPTLVAETITIRNSTTSIAHTEIEQIGDTVLPLVVGDARRLQQAILNILINAEQAIASVDRSPRIIVSVTAAPPGLVIHIDDSGPGIPADLLPRIFDPFFTTKDVGQGTGLGLAIAYGIVQDHGGTLTAGPSPLGGARFSIQLPAEW
jgi:signal transduction histidine kinase